MILLNSYKVFFFFLVVTEHLVNVSLNVWDKDGEYNEIIDNDEVKLW